MKCDVTNQLHLRHSLSSSAARENQYHPPPQLFVLKLLNNVIM